jgi:cbb3-type cytochrome oxidase subunit 3
MNPLFKAGADLLTQGGLLGLMTILFFFFFVGWTAWAWSPRRKATMEQLGALPLDDQPLSEPRS